MLAAVEAAAPVDAIDVLAVELGKHVAAQDVTFLIADYSGDALVRLSRGAATGGQRSRGDDTAVTIPLSGTPYERAVRGQRVQVVAAEDSVRVLAPVTNRGDVIGVLELTLDDEPDAATIDYVAGAAHVLGFVVVANQRFTDLFEWGQRSSPMTLAAEIQRRLLPNAFACEAGQVTIAGALEPAGHVGGDTFDYSLDRDTLHVSLTDAMGHEVDAALLATLLVGSLRNSRRQGASLVEQAAMANTALLDHSGTEQYVTGQVLRVDLSSGVAAIVNGGHPLPLRLRDGRVGPVELDADLPFGMMPEARYRAQSLTLRPGDRLVLVTDGMLERNPTGLDLTALVATTGDLHPREAVHDLATAVLRATDGQLLDDATVLCLDWHGSDGNERHADTGADEQRASGPGSAS